MALTQEDYQKIHLLNTHGTKAVTNTSPDPIETDPQSIPDRRGLSKGMCNAIREAAHDGHTYNHIASLFTFTANRQTVHKHARGNCNHTDTDMVPAVPDRTQTAITPTECKHLRNEFRTGKYDTIQAAATQYDASGWTIRHHLKGKCSHTNSEPVTPSDITGGRLRELRRGAGLSQRELAKLTNTWRKTIHDWETGEREITFVNRVKLESVLGEE